MKRIVGYVSFLLFIILLGFSGCDFLAGLFEGEVGTPSFEDYKVVYDPGGKNFYVELWWNWPDETEQFILERSVSGEGENYIELIWGEDTYFADYGYGLPEEHLSMGQTYTYRVCGYKDDVGRGDYSSVSINIPEFTAPENITTAVVGSGTDAFVRLQWDARDMDDIYYKVYRSDSLDGSYSSLGSTAHTGGTIYEDDSVEIGETYYYKICTYSVTYGADTDLSAAIAVEVDDTGGGSGSWTSLGTDGFAATADDVEMATVGGILYVLYSVMDNGNYRIVAMSHDGSVSDWASAGGFLSIGANDFPDEVYAFSDGSALYAGYADSGDGGQVYVKSFDGSSWGSVGNSDGVQYYDTQAWNAMGHMPALTCDASSGNLFMVYPTDSSNLVNSLSFPGSGDYWKEADSDFWTSYTISSFYTMIVTDSSGNHIAALRGTDSMEFYTYNGSAWSDNDADFTLSGASYVYLLKFVIDGSDNLYLAYDSLDASGYQLEAGVRYLSGSSWIDTGFASQLDGQDTINDIAVLRNAAGTGIIAAAAYETSDDTDYIEIWEYDGSSWSQTGPDIAPGIEVDKVALALDSSDRPVIVYSEVTSGDLYVRGYSE